jgi:hypothetical protein
MIGDFARNCSNFGSQCLSISPPLSSVSFESESELKRMGSEAFSNPFLNSIIIPKAGEVVAISFFEFCKSLSMISFESDSILKEIGAKAFYNSVIDSIVLTKFVENIGQSSFCGCQAL